MSFKSSELNTHGSREDTGRRRALADLGGSFSNLTLQERVGKFIRNHSWTSSSRVSRKSSTVGSSETDLSRAGAGSPGTFEAGRSDMRTAHDLSSVGGSEVDCQYVPVAPAKNAAQSWHWQIFNRGRPLCKADQTRIVPFSGIPKSVGLQSIVSQVRGGPLERIRMFPDMTKPDRNAVEIHFMCSEHAEQFNRYAKLGRFLINGRHYYPSRYFVSQYSSPSLQVLTAMTTLHARRCVVLKWHSDYCKMHESRKQKQMEDSYHRQLQSYWQVESSYCEPETLPVVGKRKYLVARRGRQNDFVASQDVANYCTFQYRKHFYQRQLSRSRNTELAQRINLRDAELGERERREIEWQRQNDTTYTKDERTSTHAQKLWRQSNGAGCDHRECQKHGDGSQRCRYQAQAEELEKRYKISESNHSPDLTVHNTGLDVTLEDICDIFGVMGYIVSVTPLPAETPRICIQYADTQSAIDAMAAFCNRHRRRSPWKAFDSKWTLNYTADPSERECVPMSKFLEESVDEDHYSTARSHQ